MQVEKIAAVGSANSLPAMSGRGTVHGLEQRRPVPLGIQAVDTGDRLGHDVRSDTVAGDHIDM
jgi:hypothetical protein